MRVASCRLFSFSVFPEWEVPTKRHQGMPLCHTFEWCQLKYAENISFLVPISCQLFKTDRLSFSFRRSRRRWGTDFTLSELFTLDLRPTRWLERCHKDSVLILPGCYKRKKKFFLSSLPKCEV